jgi:hypothetical protein
MKILPNEGAKLKFINTMRHILFHVSLHSKCKMTLPLSALGII